jgi:tetratricopeptide (TPR) repeat protein
MVAGRLRDAVEAGERAVRSFEARGNPWWAALTLWHLTSIANYLGEWKASLDYCRRALDYGIALNDIRLKAVSCSRIGGAYIALGEVERGIQWCNEALALAPIPRDTAWARAVRGYGKIKSAQVEEGIAELTEALAWFETAGMQWTQIVGGMWLAEGYLRRRDHHRARLVLMDLLNTCRTAGYYVYEGKACWLIGECLAVEGSAASEDYVRTARRIFEEVGAKNDLAKAMVTHAALRQRAGDIGTAGQLLQKAYAVFEALGTLDEPSRVEFALDALGRGSPIRVLADA